MNNKEMKAIITLKKLELDLYTVISECMENIFKEEDPTQTLTNKFGVWMPKHLPGYVKQYTLEATLDLVKKMMSHGTDVIDQDVFTAMHMDFYYDLVNRLKEFKKE